MEERKAINVFYSYAYQDKELRDELDKHLTTLKRQGQIATWHSRDITAGQNRAAEIDKHLHSAQLILLLVSPDFIASDYCYGPEMQYIMRKYDAGEIRVIPIVLRYIDWDGTPFSNLQALPTEDRPVVSKHWYNLDEAFLDITRGIRKTTQALLATPIQEFFAAQTRVPSIHKQNAPFSPLWNVPYHRNFFFTGREALLKQLTTNFTKNSSLFTSIRAQAISGLGGIGKTQLAVEYAYRNQKFYTFILWIRATTRDTLNADFIKLADILNLPDKNEQDQNDTISAVRLWLETHDKWLLILDDVNDLVFIYDLLPTTGPGHILFTTQAQSVGPFADMLEVEKMDMEEGALLLLRRAKLITTESSLTQIPRYNRIQAEAIVAELDGLPLALDQAGAYIEEIECSLTEYLELYRSHQHRKALLLRRSSHPPGHPEPVSTTWSLSCQRVEQANAAALQLLYLCAFLGPDAIPLEVITAGANDLGTVLRPVAADEWKLNEVIEDLRKFSLVRRNPTTKTLNMHRLVQSVLIDGMDKNTQKRWARRAVLAVNRALPTANETTWTQGRRYLPQARACAALIEQYGFTFAEAVRLLNETAFYLREMSLYDEAELHLQHALAISEHIHKDDLEHPAIATRLNRLAMFYFYIDKHELAEPLLQHAMAICEKRLGPEHLDTADNLSGLARVYIEQKKYAQAEQLLRRSSAIFMQTLGPNHPDIAENLGHLASLYQSQQNYEEAGKLLEQALAIHEKELGQKHPNTINILNNLANLYTAQHKDEQAIQILQRLLKTYETVRGPEHPYIANILNNLSNLYINQKQYAEAQRLLQRALAIRENVLGAEHFSTISSLNNLANLYILQENYLAARTLLQRELMLRENILGPKHPDIAILLEDFAYVLHKMDQDREATSLQLRAQSIRNAPDDQEIF